MMYNYQLEKYIFVDFNLIISREERYQLLCSFDLEKQCGLIFPM